MLRRDPAVDHPLRLYFWSAAERHIAAGGEGRVGDPKFNIDD